MPIYITLLQAADECISALSFIRRNTPHVLAAVITLALVALFVLHLVTPAFAPLVAYAAHAPRSAFLLYHFHHINIFHLAANLLALWFYRPRLTTVLIAFPVASLAAWIDTLILPGTLPTCGLSAFLFAAFARHFVAWHKSIIPFVAVTNFSAFIPTVNWHLHLISFMLSFIIWTAIYRLRPHRAQP